MTRSLEVTSNLVLEWLEGEHSYQFDKNAVTHNAAPQSSIDHIMRYELKNKWQRFQLFRQEFARSPSAQAYLQAGQQVLKATGAARGAVVWEAVARGQAVDQASTATFAVLGDYLRATIDKKQSLPDKVLLDRPLESALYPTSLTPIEEQYQIMPVYLNLAGHAINHLLDERAVELGFGPLLPRPGLPSGTIELWK